MATIDTRYARALALVVADQNLDIAATQMGLNHFADIMDESAELREVMNNPSIPDSQKMGVLQALANRAGIGDAVRNFIAVIARHGRVHQLREIVNTYAALAEEAMHVADVEITTAHPLDGANRKLLEERAAHLAGGSHINATYREDAALLGGAIVKIGSTVYDGSLRAQLQQLKHQLVTAGLR